MIITWDYANGLIESDFLFVYPGWYCAHLKVMKWVNVKEYDD